MTAAPEQTRGHADTRSRRTAWAAVALLVAAFVVAHGCHGDDVDTEPAAAPWVKSGD